MIRAFILGIILVLGTSFFAHPKQPAVTQPSAVNQPGSPTPTIVPNDNNTAATPKPTEQPATASPSVVPGADNTQATPKPTQQPVVPSPTAAPVSPSPKAAETPKGTPKPEAKNDERIVRNLVTDFGKKLQMVSLSAPAAMASQSIKENYGSYLSPVLLAKWQSDPGKALGRAVSSPWPDRIDISAVMKISDSLFKVSGEIIEITSVEQKNGGIAAKRPVTLLVAKINNYWLIDDAVAGSYTASQSVSYLNTQYGFSFALPNSWKGYTIVRDQWVGQAIGDARTVETGPRLSIRHPLWTSQNPRQDIPIMIFTMDQWNALQHEKFHIGAAPIGPSELGRNGKYVFALPARYNFAFPTGFEEVETILQGKPLQAM